MTVQATIDQLRRTDLLYDEKLCDLSQLRIEDDQLRYKSLSLRWTEPSLQRLCRKLGAPPEYISGLPGELRSPLLAHHMAVRWVSREPAVLLHRQGTFVALTRPDLLRLDTAAVLETVANSAGQFATGLEVHSVTNTNDCYRIDLLSHRAAHEVAPGDVLEAGVRITHSPIGDHALWIEAFVHRLVCENGMTHRECNRQGLSRTRRLPASLPDAKRQQLDQVSRLASQTWSSLQRKLGVIAQLRNQRLDVPHLLRSWIARARLSARLFGQLLIEDWEREGAEQSAYGAVNALTRAATHRTELTHRQRDLLGGLACILAFRNEHLGPRCFSVLRGSTHSVN